MNTDKLKKKVKGLSTVQPSRNQKPKPTTENTENTENTEKIKTFPATDLRGYTRITMSKPEGRNC